VNALKFLSEKNDALIVRIHVIPNARVKRESERFEILEDNLVVRIEEPPIKGQANKALIKLLAKILGVPKGNIEIIKGETSRDKLIRITGVTKEIFLRRIKDYK